MLGVTPFYDVFADKYSENDKNLKVVVVEKLKEKKFINLSDGKIAQNLVHIFYKDTSKKSEKMNGNGPPTDKGNNKKNPSLCFSFTKGLKWKSTEPYVINPNNNDNLNNFFLESRTLISVNKWDDQVSFDIFGPGSIDDTAEFSENLPDGKNAILFGSFDNPNVIAATQMWFTVDFRGKMEMIEWDIQFNDIFPFGDAGPTDENNLGNVAIMDWENVLTHELGHAAALGHPPVKDSNNDGIPDEDDPCSEETMYFQASMGETKKRTLNSGDINGIKRLY